MAEDSDNAQNIDLEFPDISNVNITVELAKILSSDLSSAEIIIPEGVLILDENIKNLTITLFNIVATNPEFIAQTLANISPDIMVSTLKITLPTPNLHHTINQLVETYPGAFSCQEDQNEILKSCLSILTVTVMIFILHPQ